MTPLSYHSSILSLIPLEAMRLLEQITTIHWRFQPDLMPGKNSLKKFFYNFIYFIINLDFYVITFSMHYTLLTIFFRRNKVNCYRWFDWIFHVSDYLKSFMIYFDYDLILLRYSSSGSVLFVSPLLLY